MSKFDRTIKLSSDVSDKQAEKMKEKKLIFQWDPLWACAMNLLDWLLIKEEK